MRAGQERIRGDDHYYHSDHRRLWMAEVCARERPYAEPTRATRLHSSAGGQTPQ
jgi:hypothetical protein